MVKPLGFTLLEMVVVIAITAVLALAALPNMNLYVSKQELKLASSELVNYIQSARNYSATTECKSNVTFEPSNGLIKITVKLEKDTQWRGCNRWFEASGHDLEQAVTIRTGTVNKATLAQAVSVTFNGVSGNLSGNSVHTLQLTHDSAKGTLQLSGIGNGVFQYVN